MVWKRRAIRWCGHGGLGFAVLVVLSIMGFLWLAQEYTRTHPLSLTPYIPQVEKYVLPDGLKLDANRAELFFDSGPVIRVNGLSLSGADGQMGVFVEQAAIKLSSSQLFLLAVAPKMVEAQGVTLRIVRGENGMSIAGLNLPKTEDSSDDGVVEWLNGLTWNRVWGRLQHIRIANLNLLMRDDVQQAEWVLENGNMVATLSNTEGERGTLTAMVRRLYGNVEQAKGITDVPVLVSFAHAPKADGMEVRGRLDRANAQMVTDYFPPQFKDLVQAQGQVEIGTRILTGSRIEQPWVTMRLSDVSVNPPEGFSEPLTFPKLTITASYVPPQQGPSGPVSDTDILMLREVEAETKRGATFFVSGTITGIQADPAINISLFSPQGPVQGIFDFFPDQVRGTGKALKWVRPNIKEGEYTNLIGHYVGSPSAFPGCGDQCGLFELNSSLSNAKVTFLDDISPAEAEEGTFQWRGQTFTIGVPKATIGNQKATNVVVNMSNIFSKEPTVLRVTGNLSGDASGVMAELNRIEELKGKVPLGVTGNQSSLLDILVPLGRGEEDTSFAHSTVLVSSSVVNARVTGLKELKGLDFAAPLANVSLSADKTLRIEGDGTLGGSPMKAVWSQNMQPKMPDMMTLTAQGTASAEWLMSHVSVTAISATGLVGVNFAMREDEQGKWLFSGQAEASRVSLTIPATNTVKPVGENMLIEARGSYMPTGPLAKQILDLEKLDVQGRTINAGGTVRINPSSFENTVINLPRLKLGKTDVSVNLSDGHASIVGNVVDLSNYDILGTRKPAATVSATQPSNNMFQNIGLNISVTEVLLTEGKLNKVLAQARSTDGKWDISRVNATIDQKNRISINRAPIPNQRGRERMTISVDDLGQALGTLGIYQQLTHGKLTGEITYDSKNIGGGVLKLDDFELKSGSILVQIMSMLSLEQLLSGTDATLFKTGTIPVRVDGSQWYIDNASFSGPSMDLRLTGTYNRENSALNIDGKLAPGIPLNRVVGKIPLLGTILTGSQDGVVVADFKIKGTTDEPQINVRPLSVITPGLLKDFWRGLTGSSQPEGPKPDVQDGRQKK